MKLTYPAVFEPLGDQPGYVVTIPDLPGCVTQGDSLADAILMANNAASGWVLDELEDGNPVPISSDISAITLEPDQFVSLLVLDMDAYAEKYGSKAVRKNLTIPAWLNTFAESRHINFSKVLTESLTTMYQNQAEN